MQIQLHVFDVLRVKLSMMDTHQCRFEMSDTEFYLHVTERGILIFIESELQCDSWAKVPNTPLKSIILNCFKQGLEAYPEELNGSCTLFRTEYDKDRAIFELQVYKDTTRRGFPVAFSIKYNGKTYYLYCTSSKELSFKEGALPAYISGTTSDIIFYQKTFSRGDVRGFLFESALVGNHFLAFQDGENGSQKLILKQSFEDEVDEFKRFQISAP
ncbi:interleukin-18-like [Spea bombifrons]|uniref:interleukin-18-like n=1 Tax=Spea bombifrons TaxID=233779 RepID=UPI002349FF07|nr:interleukin-18-like [Spea bombifrons]